MSAKQKNGLEPIGLKISSLVTATGASKRGSRQATTTTMTLPTPMPLPIPAFTSPPPFSLPPPPLPIVHPVIPTYPLPQPLMSLSVPPPPIVPLVPVPLVPPPSLTTPSSEPRTSPEGRNPEGSESRRRRPSSRSRSPQSSRHPSPYRHSSRSYPNERSRRDEDYSSRDRERRRFRERPEREREGGERLPRPNEWRERPTRSNREEERRHRREVEGERLSLAHERPFESESQVHSRERGHRRERDIWEAENEQFKGAHDRPDSRSIREENDPILMQYHNERRSHDHRGHHSRSSREPSTEILFRDRERRIDHLRSSQEDYDRRQMLSQNQARSHQKSNQEEEDEKLMRAFKRRMERTRQENDPRVIETLNQRHHNARSALEEEDENLLCAYERQNEHLRSSQEEADPRQMQPHDRLNHQERSNWEADEESLGSYNCQEEHLRSNRANYDPRLSQSGNDNQKRQYESPRRESRRSKNSPDRIAFFSSREEPSGPPLRTSRPSRSRSPSVEQRQDASDGEGHYLDSLTHTLDSVSEALAGTERTSSALKNLNEAPTLSSRRFSPPSPPHDDATSFPTPGFSTAFNLNHAASSKTDICRRSDDGEEEPNRGSDEISYKQPGFLSIFNDQLSRKSLISVGPNPNPGPSKPSMVDDERRRVDSPVSHQGKPFSLKPGNYLTASLCLKAHPTTKHFWQIGCVHKHGELLLTFQNKNYKQTSTDAGQNLRGKSGALEQILKMLKKSKESRGYDGVLILTYSEEAIHFLLRMVKQSGRWSLFSEVVDGIGDVWSYLKTHHPHGFESTSGGDSSPRNFSLNSAYSAICKKNLDAATKRPDELAKAYLDILGRDLEEGAPNFDNFHSLFTHPLNSPRTEKLKFVKNAGENLQLFLPLQNYLASELQQDTEALWTGGLFSRRYGEEFFSDPEAVAASMCRILMGCSFSFMQLLDKYKEVGSSGIESELKIALAASMCGQPKVIVDQTIRVMRGVVKFFREKGHQTMEELMPEEEEYYDIIQEDYTYLEKYLSKANLDSYLEEGDLSRDEFVSLTVKCLQSNKINIDDLVGMYREFCFEDNKHLEIEDPKSFRKSLWNRLWDFQKHYYAAFGVNVPLSEICCVLENYCMERLGPNVFLQCKLKPRKVVVDGKEKKNFHRNIRSKLDAKCTAELFEALRINGIVDFQILMQGYLACMDNGRSFRHELRVALEGAKNYTLEPSVAKMIQICLETSCFKVKKKEMFKINGICYRCGSDQHLGDVCNANKKKLPCLTCRKLGHIAISCKEEAGNPMSRISGTETGAPPKGKQIPTL